MLTGVQLKEAILSGAANIKNQRARVDELNVFPVPDGDTGTNMSMTIGNAVGELSALTRPAVGETARVAANALLRGARGNSGVILSLLFRGIAKSLKGKEEASGQDLAEAMRLGVKMAYGAVMNPTEGTILTVARLAAEAAARSEESDPIAMVALLTEEMERALELTPTMLPVLKKSGVVDAGGFGLVTIFKGMLLGLQGEPIKAETEQKPLRESLVMSPVDAAAEYDGEITFTYCTEFIVMKDENARDALALRAFLETIGDSAVVVDADDIIKVHVHTDHPGRAIEEGLTFGQLTKLKIENMREQHETRKKNNESRRQDDDYRPVSEDTAYGFVAVAAGAGLHALFADLGVNRMVSGGQTMNPSTDDILKAVQSVPAKTVFVLPNNKNIIMAAEQAAKLADRKVCVLQSRTIPQGIAAMLAFDPEGSLEENQIAMTHALDRVGTGQITFAARDSDFDGHKIKQGELLALENGKLAFTERDLTRTLIRLTRGLLRRDSSFVTVISGSDVTDRQAEQDVEALRQKLGDRVDVTLLSGGQPVYYYLISVE